MKLPFVFKIIISAVFLWVLAKVAGSDSFTAMVSQADPLYVAASFGLSFVMIALSCAKWRVLLGHQGRKVGFLRLYRIYFVGYFYTTLLPSAVGGDVARSYLVGREVGSQGDAAISVFMERFTGFIVLLLLMIVAPGFKPALYRESAVYVPALGSVLLLWVLWWVYRVEDPLGGIVDRLGERAPAFLQQARVKAMLIHGKLVDSIRRLGRNRNLLALVMVMTCMFYMLTWVNVWVSFKAFGVDVPILDVAAILPASMLLAMLPIVPLAGLGLAESVYVFYFGMLDVASPASLAMGSLLRLKLIFVGIIGWGCQMAPGIERLGKRKMMNGGGDGE